MEDLRLNAILNDILVLTQNPTMCRLRNVSLLILAGLGGMAFMLLPWWGWLLQGLFLLLGCKLLKDIPITWRPFSIYAKTWPLCDPPQWAYYSDGASAQTHHERLEHLNAFPPVCIDKTTSTRIFAIFSHENVLHLVRMDHLLKPSAFGHFWSVSLLARRAL